MAKGPQWARGRRGEPRLCMTCGTRAENRPPEHCTEARHHAYSEARSADKNNRSRSVREARRKRGIPVAALRGNVSLHGRCPEPDLPGEMWLPFDGSYRVSCFGRVRSVHGWLMKQTETAEGYRTVTVVVDGRKKTRFVHSIVCAAFHGPRPDGMQVAHGDGRPWNNRAYNLRWATAEENANDKRLHGTLPIGERSGCARLSEADVRQMLGDHRSGMPVVQVAKKYGVHTSHASLILRGKLWKHVFTEL